MKKEKIDSVRNKFLEPEKKKVINVKFRVIKTKKKK